jgi:hypothetical protein
VQSMIAWQVSIPNGNQMPECQDLQEEASLILACQMTLDIVERAEQRGDLEDIRRSDAISIARIDACQNVVDSVLKLNRQHMPSKWCCVLALQYYTVSSS